jgi:hypothetical protein
MCLSVLPIVKMNKLHYRHTALLYVQLAQHLRTRQQPTFQAGDTVAFKEYHVRSGSLSKFGGYRYPASCCTKSEADESAEYGEGVQKVDESSKKPLSHDLTKSSLALLGSCRSTFCPSSSFPLQLSIILMLGSQEKSD